MILRKYYLDLISPFVAKSVVKVITGVRRCGKSTFLLQIMDKLRKNGVKSDNIIYINKELFQFDEIKGYKDLFLYISSKSKKKSGFYYLFIDEVQEIHEWEKAIVSLLAEKKFDIFITGSNAHMLSSELATLLTGRYIELKMYPFVFSEFFKYSVSRDKQITEDKAFELFMKYGGFPGIHMFDWNDNAIRQYLQSLYNTILLKDVVIRNSVRDAAMLEKIIEYLISNCGNITSANKISQYVKSQHRIVSVETVQNYINYTCAALMMYQAKRFDVKGKRLLESNEKYFVCDTGFSFSTIGFTPERIPGILENIVFIELLSRGYRVNIGKLPDREIDFIAEKNTERIYIQVCTSLINTKVFEREYRAFEFVSDHFPKLVVSMDKGFDTSVKGIRWMNIKDFLLK